MGGERRAGRRIWSGLRWKITGQVLVAALVPAILVAIITLMMMRGSFDEIERELGVARDMTAQVAGNTLSARANLVARRLDESVLVNLEAMSRWVALPSVVDAAKDAATSAEELGLAENDLDTLESLRASDRTLNHDAGLRALMFRLVSTSDFIEIFFTEEHGYIVATSNPTSDFVQSDEEWWTSAWETGFYVGAMELDESTGAFVIPFAIRVDDPVNGRHLGVMKLGLDISNVEALAVDEAATVDQGSILIFDRLTGDRLADTMAGNEQGLLHTTADRLRAGVDTPLTIAADLRPGAPIYVTGQNAGGEALVTGYALSGGMDLYGTYSGFEGFDWVVAVSQPERVVMATVDALSGTQSQLQDQFANVIGIFGVIGLLTLAGGILMAAWQTRLIVNPILRLQGAAQRLSEGDLAARADVSANDEVGDLALAFNRMGDDLQAMVEAERDSRVYLERTISEYMAFVEAVSNGNLVTRLDLHHNGALHDETEDDLYQLGVNLNSMVVNLYDMARQVGETSVAVSSAATEIQAAATQLVASANEQDSAVTQTVATVEEVRATVKQTAERAQQVADASQQSIVTSGDGQNAVANSIAGMQLIRQRVESIAETILMLSERTQQIGEIINTVNALADQSKLLALNASIEAARAGEEGKGFAVVAMEVRELAEQSREATARVRDILSEIQQATNTAVIVTEDGSKGADAGVELVERAGESIRDLAATIEESAQSAMQIAASTHQQTNGMDQLAAAMNQIRQTTIQTAGSMRQTEQSVRDLLDMARQMEAAIARYEL